MSGGVRVPPPSLPLPTARAEIVAPFVAMALDCVHRAYPNQIAHAMTSDEDARPPRELTPVFYGCYDWHSAVHGHWLLARACRCFPSAAFVPEARRRLAASLRPEAVEAEVAYLARRPGFERPYGLAWLVALQAELVGAATDPGVERAFASEAITHAQALTPLAGQAFAHLARWLPRLSHPTRVGTHAQTAFSLGLLLDACRALSTPAERAPRAAAIPEDAPGNMDTGTGADTNTDADTSTGTDTDTDTDTDNAIASSAALQALASSAAELAALVYDRAHAFFGHDHDYPLHLEPGGEDFLSPALGAADLMRRVLAPAELSPWLDRTLGPSLRYDSFERALAPVAVTDPTDGRLAHLDGLNLSRAWMLEGVASALPEGDARRERFIALAAKHATIALAAIDGAHYAGSHWLGTFACYLVTRSGLRSF